MPGNRIVDVLLIIILGLLVAFLVSAIASA